MFYYVGALVALGKFTIWLYKVLLLILGSSISVYVFRLLFCLL